MIDIHHKRAVSDNNTMLVIHHQGAVSDNTTMIVNHYQGAVLNNDNVTTHMFNNTLNWNNDSLQEMNMTGFPFFDHPFDVPHIRWIFISLFSLVFICCVVGEYVILSKLFSEL